jgi:hypothetical protein
MPTKWCTIAPLAYWGFLDVPFSLANSVILSSMPNWVREEEIKKNVGMAGSEVLEDGQYALVREYEADSLGEPDPEWHKKPPRSKQSTAHEAIQLADFALWLAKPSSIGFKLIIHADEQTGTWRWRHLGRSNQLLPHAKDEASLIEKGELDLAHKLHSALLNLPRDGAVWIAVRTLWQGLTQEEWTVRYLLLWIVLEALYGTTDTRETTYRLAQRLAFFLSKDRVRAQTLFQDAKAGYTWRSRVVHGMRLRKLSPEKSSELMYETERFARESLLKILMSADLIKTFSGSEREILLDSLVYSAK